jgi:hypothetical protein
VGRPTADTGMPACSQVVLRVPVPFERHEYQGVDLYQFFLDSANSDSISVVTFNQDGSPPVVKE